MPIRTARRLALCGALLVVHQAWSQDTGAKEKPGAAGQKPGGETALLAQIGQTAPEFSLLDCEGKKHKLSDYKDKLVVLEWLNQECPYSVKALPVMKDLRKKYDGKGIVWLGIESTFSRKPEENLQYGKDKGLDFPILMDNDGQVGRMYGALVTPHIYVIDKTKLVYAGALRSKPEGGDKESGDRNYLDETLTAVLAGKAVPLAQTTPWGCRVKYKPGANDRKPGRPTDDTQERK